VVEENKKLARDLAHVKAEIAAKDVEIKTSLAATKAARETAEASAAILAEARALM